MKDWNIVVTVHEHEHCYRQASRFLKTFGELGNTDFFNVLTLRVANIEVFLKQLHQQFDEEPQLFDCIARVLPVSHTFSYKTPEEFEAKAEALTTPWGVKLAGTRFHVRMHRRGFKGRMSSQEEEKNLADILMCLLAERGETASVDFYNPDFIVVIETIGQQAGVSLWSREELLRYPLIKLD